MIEIFLGLTIVIVLLVIVWASNTLKEEYRYKNTIHKNTINQARLDKDGKKKHLVSGRP